MFHNYGWMEAYGTLSLTESSPVQQFVEPFSVAEIKKFLELPPRSPIDPEEDQLLTDFITGARVQAEYLQARDLVQKQWDLSVDYWLDYAINLRKPLVSVDLFTIRDSTGVYSTLIENTDFISDLRKAVLMPPYNAVWRTFTPWPSSAILIRHTSGYNNASVFWRDDGQAIKTGMRRLINDWFTGRLPFERNVPPGSMEIPFGVTQMLSTGALRLVG